MTDLSFEAALNDRVGEMLDACTRCGKCVEACPSVQPAGIADASPTDVISGIIDFLRAGSGPEASRKWAASCTLSGHCIQACDENVNPRFLLAMARGAMRRKESDLATRRRNGVTKYRQTSRDVATLSRMQLDSAMLERLGQGTASLPAPDEVPDFVFYTGCNVLRTPHIALLALDIMDALGISYSVMGGPSHCCGVMQLRAGDPEMSGRMGTSSIDKMSNSKSGVLSWCPSCYVQLSETTLPAIERQRGAKPFEMTPFLRYLRGRLGDLRPRLREPVKLRVALHRHSGVAGVVEAALDMLRAVLGQSMGLHRHDRHKELKLTQDADLIVKECADLIAAHALDPALAREVVVKAMLGDQPLPLKGSATPKPTSVAPPA
jgi:heterodisulfide reductase subunit D